MSTEARARVVRDQLIAEGFPSCPGVNGISLRCKDGIWMVSVRFADERHIPVDFPRERNGITIEVLVHPIKRSWR